MTDVRKVFISSTLEDLRVYRAAARRAVERMGWAPLMCDYWSAGPHKPLDTCLAEVKQADLLVVIVGNRHGWTPSDQPGGAFKSITHLECEYAREILKIDVLPFFAADDAELDPDYNEEAQLRRAKTEERKALSAIVNRNLDSLDGFRHWLDATTTRAGFASADQLELLVYQGLDKWRERRGLGITKPNKATVRTDYLDWLRRTCETVELLGLDLKDAQNVRLGQVYVSAVTDPSAPQLGRYEGDLLLLHRLGEQSLYVSGDAGSGKSIFCRWTALAVLGGDIPRHSIAAPEPYRETLSESLQTRFPLLVRLRELAGMPDCLRGNGNWNARQLLGAFGRWLEVAAPGGLTMEVFSEALDTGEALLILDGVDEVPEKIGEDLPRRNLLTGLADALPGWIKNNNRVLITSRPYGLTDAERRALKVHEARLQKLPDELQRTFVARWYAAADPLRSLEKTKGLIKHMGERKDLDDLRPNPMLLTALCVKYDQGQRLPKDFFELYESVTSQVLHSRYPARNDQTRIRLRLAAVALAMHRGTDPQQRVTPAAQVSVAEIDRALLSLDKSDPTTEHGAADAATRREELLSNSGLLLPRADSKAAFYHLSFQEYFAAVRLRQVGEDVAQILATYSANPAWHKTLTFLFCAVADQSAEEAVRRFAPLERALDFDRLSRDDLNPTLLLADCLAVARGRGWSLARYAPAFHSACERALAELMPERRSKLWRALERSGLDERRGVGVCDGLPDVAWEDVLAGPFKYQAECHKRTLPEFSIARYPVTNAQYQSFIDDGGYHEDRWWTELKRMDLQGGAWEDPHHPRETVSGFEALAFCAWLTARLREAGELSEREEVRLPTEYEWEKMARGTDERFYPWGEYRHAHANIVDESQNLGRTTSVGIYPKGASPYGALDVCGNVWEWCANPYNGKQKWLWAVRGGSWSDKAAGARVDGRIWADPDVRRNDFGFRLCRAWSITKKSEC